MTLPTTVDPDLYAELRDQEYPLMNQALGGDESEEAEWAALQQQLDLHGQGNVPMNGQWLWINPHLPVGAHGIVATQGDPTANTRRLSTGWKIALGGMVGVLVLIACLWAWLLQSLVAPHKPARAPEIASGGITPTLTVSGTEVVPAILAHAGQAPLATEYPQALTVGGGGWTVIPTTVAAGNWLAWQTPGEASWLAGTVINPVIGLWAGGTNPQILAAIQAGDPAVVTLTPSQSLRRFQLGTPHRVARLDTTIFAQQQPGLTLVLIGDTNQATRWVVTGTQVLVPEP